jgi:hypothetical protein
MHINTTESRGKNNNNGGDEANQGTMYTYIEMS